MISDEAEPRRTLIRFLLGEVSDQEHAGLEEKYIKDTGLFHHLVELESDLIDLYAIGALSWSERKRLERSFLADPERRRRLEFARVLTTYPSPRQPADLVTPADSGVRIPAWFRSDRVSQPIAAVLLVVMLAGGTWLLVTNRNLRVELETARQQQAVGAKRAEGLQQQVGNLTHELDSFSRNAEPKQPVPSDQHLVAFILRADAFRGNGEVSELTIPSTASMVALRLVFPADTFSSYSLSIETADKEAVWREQHVKGQNAGASSKEIVVRVPARALKAGDYALRISASNGDVTEDVAGYSFRVKRR